MTDPNPEATGCWHALFLSLPLWAVVAGIIFLVWWIL